MLKMGRKTKPAHGRLQTMPRNVKRMYSGPFRSYENKLGGGEGVLGIYGSITGKYMQLLLHTLCRSGGLTKTSVLTDIGSGLGRPLIHALVYPGVQCAMGYELDPVKHAKSLQFAALTCRATPKLHKIDAQKTRLQLYNKDICEVSSLGPTTHVYSFWEGIPTVAKEAVGRLFSSSPLAQAIAVVQRHVRDPVSYMEDLGFRSLELIAKIPVSTGNGGFQAYLFVKTQTTYDNEPEVASETQDPPANGSYSHSTPTAEAPKFRQCSHAPEFEVSAGGVVRRIADGAIMRVKMGRDGQVMARLYEGGKERSLALRNLVAVAWLDGAAERLELSPTGLQVRKKGAYRVGHLDGMLANNVASNLTLIGFEG